MQQNAFSIGDALKIAGAIQKQGSRISMTRALPRPTPQKNAGKNQKQRGNSENA